MIRKVLLALMAAALLHSAEPAKDKRLETITRFMFEPHIAGDEFQLHVFDKVTREIIFTSGGFQFTVYYYGLHETTPAITRPFVIVFARPAGVADDNATRSIIDENLDGAADHGSGWLVSMGGIYDRARKQGSEFRAEYQDLYDQAIAAAMQMIENHLRAGKCPCTRKKPPGKKDPRLYFCLKLRSFISKPRS